MFIESVGYPPENDDLERCNCPLEGQFGHMSCGWDAKANLPWFMSPNLRQRYQDLLG